MIGYKWLTKDKKAFYNGYQFVYGWNREDGPKDGMCCAGGYHVYKNSWVNLSIAPGSTHFNPAGEETYCYKVFYLKRDVLGEDMTKVRVRAFKLLKKRPCRYLASSLRPQSTPSRPYVTFTDSASTSACSTYGNVYLSDSTSTGY